MDTGQDGTRQAVEARLDYLRLDASGTDATSDGATPAACSHAPGRPFHNPLVREMLRALGVVTCPTCHEARRILGPRCR